MKDKPDSSDNDDEGELSTFSLTPDGGQRKRPRDATTTPHTTHDKQRERATRQQFSAKISQLEHTLATVKTTLHNTDMHGPETLSLSNQPHHHLLPTPARLHPPADTTDATTRAELATRIISGGSNWAATPLTPVAKPATN